jgi:hypothetical protein
VSENIGSSEVIAENLSAYYFCHSRLPGAPQDFYFSDTDNDIVVMISGFVVNKVVSGIKYQDYLNLFLSGRS